MNTTTHGAQQTVDLANAVARLAQALAMERANNRLLLSILVSRPIGDHARAESAERPHSAPNTSSS